jgi:hypothetical protein
LNGGYYDHHEEFSDLLHFNLVDWEATKDALLAAAEPLRQVGISRTGQWALVYLLRATGDSQDAAEADRSAEELTKDRERIEGWRLIEDYCATDPCNPLSDAPGNISNTARKYMAIDTTKLYCMMGMTHDDEFFTAAQPGLARFCPQPAIDVLRAFADQAVARNQPEFRRAVFLLSSHSVALEDRVTMPYIEKAREIAQAVLDAGEDKNYEGWVAAQYALSVAFPHMTGDEQLAVLINHPKDKTILLDLCYLFRPIDETKLECALDRALQEGNPVAQFRIVYFAEHSRTPLTIRAKKIVLDLMSSPDRSVRLSALALTHATADRVLLAGLAESGWSAASLDAASDAIEILHGSLALALAAEQGDITLEVCLDRVAPSAYEILAERLGPDATMAVANRLDTAIRNAAGFQVMGNLPHIEQHFEGRYRSVTIEVSDRLSHEEGLQERSKRRAESSDAWYLRQKQNWESSDRFKRDLTKSGAQLIIQSVTSGLMAAIDNAVPALVDSWCALFLDLDSKAFNNIHNIASVVAEAVSKRDVAASLSLFVRLRASSPHAHVTFGRERVGLDAIMLWRASESDKVREMCFARLDGIGNDHELAAEVLAAIRADRLDAVRRYVIDRRCRAEPAHRARAAMVAGLSPSEPWAIETVDMLKDEHGFLQGAYEGAKFAMERHQWARYWIAQMRTATNTVDLWRCTVLLSKIVDGRFKATEVEGDQPNPLIKRFSPMLYEPIYERIRKWKGKRNSKLFGMTVPNKVFLPRDFDWPQKTAS